MAISRVGLVSVAQQLLGQLDTSVDDSQLQILLSDPQVQLVLTESARVIKRRHDCLTGNVTQEPRLKLVGLAELKQQIVHLDDGWANLEYFAYDFERPRLVEDLIEKLAVVYGAEELALEETVLRVHQLLTPFAGRNLLSELGGPQRIALNRIEMWAMLLKQSKGQPGHLHVDGQKNHFFIWSGDELLDIVWFWSKARQDDDRLNSSGWYGDYDTFFSSKHFISGVRIVTR